MPLRAFIVEDNPLIRENVSATLVELCAVEMLGWAADEATARLWLAEGAPWELLIVDMFLDQGNGLGVLEAVRERRAGQHAVVLTNYATAEIRARCAGLGADAVFDKSREIEQFIAYCEQLPRRA